MAAERPSNLFYGIMKILRTASGLVGANAFDNYSITWLTKLVMASIVSYFILTIWTIVKLFSEDWKILVEATCMASSVIQGAAKLYCHIANAKMLKNRRFFLESFYKEYECKGERYEKVLRKRCLELKRIVQLISVTYFGPAIMALSLPFLLLLWNGQRYLIMQFHVPYLDINTSNGHFSTLAIHTCFMLTGFVGDLAVVIYLWQCSVFKDIFVLKIADLNDMLELKEVAAYQRNAKAMEKLFELVKFHQLCNDYTKDCNDVFYVVISIVVSTAGASILLSLFILLYGTWPAAGPYAIVCLYNLYVYCILGTHIGRSNDEFSFQIFNINWYKMPPSHQKVVALMLLQSQKPQEVKVAGVAPLSVSTALQITKTVYSMFTMLVQFMNE